MLFNRYESSIWESQRRMEGSVIEPTRSRRKLFFRRYQVLRAKHRVCDKKLPDNRPNGCCWLAMRTIAKSIFAQSETCVN